MTLLTLLDIGDWLHQFLKSLLTIPDEYHAWADVLRIIIAAWAVIDAALVFRLSWLQQTNPEVRSPNWWANSAFILCLLMISGIRFEHFGQPITFDLWLSLAVLILTTIALLVTMRFKAPTGIAHPTVTPVTPKGAAVKAELDEAERERRRQQRAARDARLRAKWEREAQAKREADLAREREGETDDAGR